MNKTITIDLRVGSINQAIRKLELERERIERCTERLVETLVDGGAEAAKNSFGHMASVDTVSEGGFGIIEAVGEAVIIAEFGAGMATMENHPMVENAPVDVYRGSYSEQVGSGEFAETYELTGHGLWHFGGKVYTEVIPRHGLLDAREYVVNNLETKARSVFA